MNRRIACARRWRIASTAFGAARGATVVREATKLHETTYRGSLRELLDKSNADADFCRGEIVLLIAGAPQAESAAADADGQGGALDKVLTALLAELPLEASGAPGGANHRRARQRGL